MRQRLKRIITDSRLLLHILNRSTGNFPKVMVYHRFAPSGVAVPHRVSADIFAWQLDTIQKDFDVISFGDCIARFLHHGFWPKGCVVLTVDDGYSDMYEWAWPELARRKMPATFFVTTRFVDGSFWLWPDQLEYALNQTDCTSCSVSIAGEQVLLSLKNESERSSAWQLFISHCIRSEENQRLSFIRQVLELLAVELPSTPPPEYCAVSWDHLREMQRGGIEIGGHTMSHPILSKISPESLDREIGTCKQILEERLGNPVRSFCYPNSGPGDINNDVIAAVDRAGYSGAVFGTDLASWDRFQTPRMGINDNCIDFVWKLYGGESLAYRTRKVK
ncbi:MAG: polysaccharide deacetylase family protein [Desulfuromonadaceae bacterium]|nr:polysaccharide deacetylase family protein [Desulfuromonadaceae bacterium]MDD5104825.1 polysaccharide deacetylase family protein [Desulfuromonadaceae bacterium]